jgi:hypothetical protein
MPPVTAPCPGRYHPAASRVAATAVTVLAAAAGTPAWAQEPEPAVEAEAKKAGKERDAKEVRERKERKFDMEIGMRLRRMAVPKALLDVWFFNEDTTPNWPLPGQERPPLAGWAYGLEWVFRDGRTSGIVWVDWIASTMPEGYWDDVDDDGDAIDGDWLRPSPNFGLLAVGGDYQFEVPFVKPGATRGAFGMGLVVGGGLGVGVRIGNLARWTPGDDDTPSFVLLSEGAPPNADDKKIPPVFPIVDFNLGLNLVFGERLVIRLEGGLHTMLYYGASAGFRF